METREAPTSSATQTAPPPERRIVTPPGTDPAEVEQAKERRRFPVWLIVAGAIVLIVVLIFGLRALMYSLGHQTTDDAQIDADQVAITSKISERVQHILVDTNQPVKKGQLLIALDSRDEAQRVAQARAQYGAAVAQANAAQANVTLTRDTQAAQGEQNAGLIDQANAAIANASEQAQSAGSQTGAAQAAVDAAAAQLRVSQDAVPAANQSLQKAQADLARTQSLVHTGDIPAADLDAARATYQGALASYHQSQSDVSGAAANLAQAQQRLAAQRYAAGAATAQISSGQGSLVNAQGKLAESQAPSRVAAQQAQADAAQATIETYRAQLKTEQDQLSYTQIRSPIDGYVGEKTVEVGTTVQPGQTLMSIVPSGHVYVTANFKETQIGKMHAGQDVDVRVDAYPGVNFTGRVATISPASENRFSLVPAQNATGNFVKVTQRVPVRIEFVNPDPAYPLRPGMSVEASVKVK